MPTVSVIVPVYRVEPWLCRCVDSVLAQSFQDFELILVDDGSPDNCGAICDEYAAGDSRIRVIHKENGGLSSARNAGLAIAQGDYIYFLDSDDYIEPDLLNDTVAVIQNCDLVFFNYCKEDEAGNTLSHSSFNPLHLYWSEEAELFTFLLKEFFTFSVGFSAWHSLFKKSIIDAFNLFFEDNQIIFAEDVYFSLVYLFHSHSLCLLEKEYYHYLIRSDSIMGVQNFRSNFGRMVELSKAVEQHLSKQNGLSLIKAKYPVLFFEIFDNVLRRVKQNQPTLSIKDLRALIYSDVKDLSYFRIRTADLMHHRKDLQIRCGLIGSLRILSEFRYYLDGRLFSYRCRQTLIRLMTLVRNNLHARR